jgi:hypothetical protein
VGAVRASEVKREPKDVICKDKLNFEPVQLEPFALKIYRECECEIVGGIVISGIDPISTLDKNMER